MTAEQPVPDQAGTGPDAGPPAPDPPAAAGPRPEPVIRDRRRVRATGKHADPADAAPPDPEPGAADPEPGAAAGGAGSPAEPGLPAGPGDELAALRADLDERTRDLQRVQADFANFRKREERKLAQTREEATAHVFRALLPVLDDFDRAREHGELVEGVAAIAEQLAATTGKFGLTPFGERGDPFDPNRHEAVAHLTSPEVTEPSCVDVLRRGYLLGDRLLRPAMVAVADPAPEQPAEPDAPDRPEQS